MQSTWTVYEPVYPLGAMKEYLGLPLSPLSDLSESVRPDGALKQLLLLLAVRWELAQDVALKPVTLLPLSLLPVWGRLRRLVTDITCLLANLYDAGGPPAACLAAASCKPARRSSAAEIDAPILSMRKIGSQLRKLLPSHTSFTVQIRSDMHAATSRTTQCDTCMDRGLLQSQERNKALMVPSHRKLPGQNWKLSSEAGRVSLSTPLTQPQAQKSKTSLCSVSHLISEDCVSSRKTRALQKTVSWLPVIHSDNGVRQWHHKHSSPRS